MGSTITIDFHGDRLLGIENERGAFVYIKPIVERMGLDWSAQLKRIKRDPILTEGVAIMAIPPEFGGANDAVFLRLDLFHGWLFTVDSGRVKPDVKSTLLAYQREAYAVLAAAFSRPVRTAEILPSPAEAVTMPEARKLVTEARMSFGERAARELWFKTGLPIVPAMMSPPRQGDLFSFRREG